MTDRLRIERAEPGLVVIVLSGEQEAFQSARLEPLLRELVRQRASVVVDLSAATFVDSTTLSVLLSAQREAHRAGLGFVVETDASMTAYARRIFEITGVDALFAMATTRDEALAAARAGATGAEAEGASV